MRKKMMALGLALAMVIAPAAFAAHNPPGFETGSCAYPANKPLPGSGTVREVPTAYPTIQKAVDAANEGDTIQLLPGTYNESVLVQTDALRIRGTERNTVILDGQSTKEVGFEVRSDYVLVENLTVHNYKNHGVRWFAQTGYWGRYITSYNNGLYGLYAFGSRCGQFDHSYTSANADSGFYIGECFPCDAVIHDVVAEENAIGYSGTNAGGNLVIRDSVWRGNALGIVPNTLDGEERPPQRGATFKNNVVDSNNGRTVPGAGWGALFWGVGIALAGGQGNVVTGNTVTNNALVGVVIAPIPDRNLWVPSGNVIWGNTVTHDAELYPDGYDLGQGAASGTNNCWADNTFGNSQPPQIQDVWSCALTTTPPGGSPLVEIGLAQGAAGINGREPARWQTWPAPGSKTAQPAALAGPISCWLPALGMC